MARHHARMARTLAWIEGALWTGGMACLVWVGAAWVEREAFQRATRARLEALLRDRPATPGTPAETATTSPSVPVAGDTIGHLEITRLGLSALVIEGDDEAALARAVGHLPDTPLPWQPGNSALAGHRDTFFRPLRRVKLGDEVRLTTPHGPIQYRVHRRMIVDPDDVWVLDQAPGIDLTLITCYPFDHIGPAPGRFVVQATRTPAAGAGPPLD